MFSRGIPAIRMFSEKGGVKRALEGCVFSPHLPTPWMLA